MQSSPIQSLIPPARLSAVEKALQKTFYSSDLTDIALLTGGLSTSAVYKITINDQKYVLKLDPPGILDSAGKEDTPRQSPANNTGHSSSMEIAAKAGIAPPLYYLNAEEGLSITGFIASQPLRTVFTAPEMLLDKLAKTIRSIHELPLFPKGNSLLNTIDTLISKVKESAFFTGIIFEDILSYYDIIRQQYPWNDTDTVSSHNDLNPSNIVCDGEKIWIIDWDAAYQNDRYVDLAIAANFFVTSEIQEKQFLEAYFGSTLNDYKSARFFIMRQICRLVYAILMFNLANTANPAPVIDDQELSTASLRAVGEQLGSGKLSISSGKGQLLFGKALLNEALNNVRSPRFASSISFLSKA